jgi:WWE domain
MHQHSCIYENGRAYPEYLVRYRKETIPPSQRKRREMSEATMSTLSCSEVSHGSVLGADGEHARVAVGISISDLFPPADTSSIRVVELADDLETGLHSDVSPPLESVVWMYECDDGRWEAFDDVHQSQIEAEYQRDPTSQLAIQNERWTYLVDLLQCTQTNIDHPSNRQRRIRRTLLN